MSPCSERDIMVYHVSVKGAIGSSLEAPGTLIGRRVSSPWGLRTSASTLRTCMRGRPMQGSFTEHVRQSGAPNGKHAIVRTTPEIPYFESTPLCIPEDLRTPLLRLLGPSTVLCRACRAIVSLRPKNLGPGCIRAPAFNRPQEAPVAPKLGPIEGVMGLLTCLDLPM